MKERLSVWERIKAYRLKNNVVVLIVLVVVFALSIAVYMIPGARENDIIANIALAVFTSLLATIFTMSAEVYVEYKSRRNDQFLTDIHSFGIGNLNQDKGRLLEELLKECDNQIWISGYRLILTRRLKCEFAEAVRRGADVTAVICPPWTEAFQLVYGTHDFVMDNYFQVFHEISKAKEGKNGKFEIFFTDKPLFNDTYRIDQKLITGPYLHNRDEEFKRITAKDFFSYNLVRKSPLYDLMYSEYETLCEESRWVLNWERFDRLYEELQGQDILEKDKIRLFRGACDEISR